MTGRERVLAALRRQVPDRVPHEVGAGLTPAKWQEFHNRTGEMDAAAYFGADVRSVGLAPTRLVQDHARYFPHLPGRAVLDEWGIGHLPTESETVAHSHLEGFLYPMQDLDTASQIADYPFPDVDADYRYSELSGTVKSYHDQGLAVAGSLECTIFEIAWYLRSMERLLIDMVDHPALATFLLDRITSLRERQARRFAELRVDILRLGDDVAAQRGMLMSVPMWRRWLKPRLARVIQSAKEAHPQILILYHSDGNPEAIIPDLIEIGVDVLNPVQSECMDPAVVKRLYGDRLAFWGTIGTQTTLPFGSPDDVRAEVKLRMETIGSGGGLLLAPTHMLEPDVPWENIVALVEAIQEYGRYHESVSGAWSTRRYMAR